MEIDELRELARHQESEIHLTSKKCQSKVDEFQSELEGERLKH